MASIDLNTVLNNPNSKVVISASALGRGVQGWIAGDLSFGGANNFMDPFTSAAQASLNALIQKAQGILATFAEIRSEKPYTAFVFENTNYVWSGSDRVRFSVPMFFVALRATDDVRKPALELYKCVFPGSQGGTDGIFMTPPLGYLPSAKGAAAKGTVQVTVGRWFQADNLVVKNVDVKFSKETIENGTPLYAEATISFETYRVMSYDEVAAFFR